MNNFPFLADENLYFDKTKNLNLFIIKDVFCQPPDLPMKINASKTGYDRGRLASHGITNLIWNHMNAEPIMKVSKNVAFL